MTQPSPRPTRARKTVTKTAKTTKTAAKTAAKPAASRRPKLPKSIQTALDAASGRKALEMVVLDLRKSDAFTDFFVIATGANSRQVQAIADAVEQALKAQGSRPAYVEGYRSAEWILLDYFDFVVHVFSPSARTFYGLERLWGTAKPIAIDEDTPE
jgi:ribosome-associated protein